MILQFQREQYAWGDTFYVLDENNKRKYWVRSSVFLWNRKFEIHDLDKNLLVTIKNEPKSLLKKKYYIFLGDEQAAAITQELSIIPKFTFEGLDWQMRGVMRHDYDMLQGSRTVLSFHQNVTAWSERPVLTVADPKEELLALAVVMTITYAMNAKEDGNSTNYL